MIRRIITKSAEETYQFGVEIGQLLNVGDLLAFSGDLGAGKTCCIQGIAVGLGVQDASQVTSPTFTLINEYQGRFPIYHFDVYRLSKKEELYDLGYEEYFYGDGVALVEWADRILEFLPTEYVGLYFHIQPDQSRQIEIQACGESYERLVQTLRCRES